MRTSPRPRLAPFLLFLPLAAAFAAPSTRAALTPAAAPYHATSAATSYKCIFNHELLIVVSQKENSPKYIQSFIDKLKDTDVDAIMCCPTAWRANLFPSEVDPTWKAYSPDQPLSKFPGWDYIMRYLRAGGDPVRDTLEACRRNGKDFFISYRMNDGHHVEDMAWPTHNAFWHQHPEYWLGDTSQSGIQTKDGARVLNYMIPEVREQYFAILQELCTRYDIDGLELDFQRQPRLFHDRDVAEGSKLLTELIRRIKDLLVQTGKARGKSLKLSVRVPQTLTLCRTFGLDVPGWDAAGLLDMVNVSSSYFQTMELGIEDFRAALKHAKVYGELNYVLTQNSKVSTFARRYTTPAVYYAAAANLFARGVDGLSLFNFDYVPAEQRLPMTPTLRRITDVAYLRTQPEDFAVYPGFGTFPAKNEKAFKVVIPDDVAQTHVKDVIMRVETVESCADLAFTVTINGHTLEAFDSPEVELFKPLAANAGYGTKDKMKFYRVPASALVAGANTIELKNNDRAKRTCTFFSTEIALYR